MNHRVIIRFEDEVDIDLGREAFECWLHELIAEDEPETYHSVGCSLSRVYGFVRDLPDEVLAKVPAKARRILGDALRRLADRLETGREIS